MKRGGRYILWKDEPDGFSNLDGIWTLNEIGDVGRGLSGWDVGGFVGGYCAGAGKGDDLSLRRP